MKKIVIVALGLAIAYFIIFMLPDIINKKKMANAEKEKARQEFVNKQAGAATGTDSGSDSSGDNWDGGAMDKARDRADKAGNRSSDYVDDHGL